MTGTATIDRRMLAEDLDLIVDNFAGGGGASLGIKWATGREPDYAVNHDEAAVEMMQVDKDHIRSLAMNWLERKGKLEVANA